MPPPGERPHGHGPREIFLKPGDWCFAEQPVRMRTVLGSCVALAVWHPQLRFGGMCHFMLPARAAPVSGDALDGRYGDEAMALLLGAIRQSGSRAADYQIKMFGGGSMFPSASSAVKHASLPQRNVEAAQMLAQRHGMTVGPSDLGAAGHRQVVFDSWSGEAWVRHHDGATVQCNGCGWKSACVLT
jgi:chemotaxis protein CheD